MAFTLVTAQTILARNAGVLYGLQLGATDMAAYALQIGTTTVAQAAFLNSVYTASVGTATVATVADVVVTGLGIKSTNTVPYKYAIDYVTAQLNTAAATKTQGSTINDIITLFSNLSTTDTTWGPLVTAYNNQITNALTYASTTGTANSNFANVSTTIATGSGSTFTLTTGIDTVSSAYTVVSAVIDQTTTGTNTTTLNVSDTVTPAANATVNLTLLSNSTAASTNGSNTAGMGSTGATTLNLKVVDGSNAAINFAALNVSGFTGLTALNIANASVSGGTVAIEDVATITGLASTTNVSLNTNGQFQAVALTGADWTGSADKLTLSVTGRNGTISATTGNESIAVTSASADARLASLRTVSATSATVAGLGLKVDASMDTTLKTFDASTSTGPVNVFLIPGTVLTSAKGGAGTADVLAVNALTTTQVVSGFEKIIAQATGSYVLTNVTGATSLGVDATLSGTVAATFTGAAATLNTISVSGAAQRTTAASSTDNLATGAISYALTTATGTTDALTLAIDNGAVASSSTTAGTLTLGGLTTTAIETVTITVADFKAVVLGGLTLNTITALSTVTITATGAANINFGAIDFSSAPSTTTTAVNFGAMTGKATLSFNAGDVNNLTYTGSAGIDTLANVAVAAAKTQTFNLGDGADVFTFLDVDAAGILIVNGDAGDDTFNGATYTTGVSTSSLLDGGAGTDTLSLIGNSMVGLKNIANVEKIVAQATGSIVDGGAVSGDTIEVTNYGTAGARLQVTALAAGATVNLGNFTFSGANTGLIVNGGAGIDIITGTLNDDTITGLGGADTITGGLGADTITGGTGDDAITLTETTASIDNLIFDASATNGNDTITGFASGAGIDTVTLLKGDTTVNTAGAAAVFETITVTTVGAATYDLNAAATTKTDVMDVYELLGTVAANGDLSASTNGSELLKLLGTTNGTAATSITVKTDLDKFFIVAYDNGNAYLYNVVDSATAGVLTLAADIKLVGTFSGVAVGDFAVNDFLMSA